MIEIPLRIESNANLREHWAKRAKRAALHRQTTAFWLKQFIKEEVKAPCTVRMIRIAPRELDDDNLAGGCKSVRDGIADWLGIDDRDPRVKWVYAQAKGKPKQYGVRIEIQPELPHVGT